MRKKFIFGLFILNSLLFASNSDKISLTKEEQNYLKNKKEIKMCLDPDWLPFEAIDKNKHIGMTSDIFDIFRKHIDTKIKLVPTNNWNESIEYAKARKCDIYSLASATPERLKYMNFTTPYLVTPIIIVTLPDKPFIDSISTIKNKKIGIVKGYAIANELRKKYPDINIVELKTLDEGLEKVSNGKIYAYIDNLLVCVYNIQRKYTNLKISGRLDEKVKLSVATRSDEPILNSIFQKLVDTLDEEKKQSIYTKWVWVKESREFDYSILWYISIIILISYIVFINRQLRLSKKNKKLKKSYAEIQNIIDTTIEAIIISENSICTNINKSAFKLFKIKNKDEMIGKPLSAFIAPESQEKVIKSMKKELMDTYEINIINSLGETIPAMVKGQNLDLNNKKIRISSIIDISELKNKEVQLVQTSKLESMKEIIENISHHWRQPLSSISTAATGMKIQKEYGLLVDEEFYKNCDEINDNAQYLSETINNFQNFLKEDNHKSKFNLKNSIDNFLTLLNSNIKSSDIEVILDLDKDIQIEGYKSELTQCLMNIFNNAKDVLIQKDIKKRYIFISTSLIEDNVMIVIKDNAGGIPEEVLPKIFEPYFTTKHQSQGTGLGLYMSYNLIVKKMNGKIEALNVSYDYDNNKYNGAEFKITLPIKKD